MASYSVEPDRFFRFKQLFGITEQMTLYPVGLPLVQSRLSIAVQASV